MDEGLCLYYTIEMLLMLENLHKVGLIHGDFKPDNLLIRSTRSESTTSDLVLFHYYIAECEGHQMLILNSLYFALCFRLKRVAKL